MFSRFKALADFSEKELTELQNSTVAVVGLGATGSVVAEHLAKHGIKLKIIDRDYLEEKDCYSSNIYTPEQCENALPKAVAAEEYLSKFADVEAKVDNLNPGNTGFLEGVDLIIDGTDNLETRFLLNEYSKKNNTPWIYTAAIGTKGYSMFFDKNCFNCVFEKISAGTLETCETAGILRETSSIAGSISATKAVEYLAGKKVEETLDTVSGKSFEVESSGCKVCEDGVFEKLSSGRTISSICGENKYQLEKDIDEKAFEKLKSQATVVAENSYLLRVKADGRHITLFKTGRAIIEAEDQGHAESIFSEMVGL